MARRDTLQQIEHEALEASYPPGRRCLQHDCITILHTGNPGPFCLCHSPQQQRRRTRVEELVELMVAA